VTQVAIALREYPLDPPRTNILGVGISAITMVTAVSLIEKWIAKHDHQYVCIATVHSVMESQKDIVLRETLCKSGLTTPDGMPLVWLSKLHGFRHVERVYGPDLMLVMFERSLEKGVRHFLYGSTPDVLRTLTDRVQSRYPGLQIVGTFSPPFRSMTQDEDADVVALINATNADIIWVGIGAPKQEQWMAAHLGYLTASVMIGVGAAFDFHAGCKRQAPRWMQRSGLEWLFRLVQEPKRLWRRYLVNNTRFIIMVLLQIMGIRRYSLLYNHG